MDTENIKSVVSMNNGSLAVFLNISKEKCEARIIGRGVKNEWEVYITVFDGVKKDYISVGRAYDKVLRFSIGDIKRSENTKITGAALGIYGKNEFFEGTINGSEKNIKKNNEKNSNIKPEISDIKWENKDGGLKENVSEKHTASKQGENKKQDFVQTMDKTDSVLETGLKELKKSPVSGFFQQDIENKSLYDEYKMGNDEMRTYSSFKNIIEKFKKEMKELQEAGILTSEETANILKGEKEESISENTNSVKSDIADTVRYTEIQEAEIQKDKTVETETEKITAEDIKEENSVQSEKEAAGEEYGRNSALSSAFQWGGKYGIDYIFSHNEKLYPFENSPYDWVRVCLDELWLLPIEKREILNSFVMLSDLKYSHLMLGRGIDKKSIVLAVPEKFNREDIKTAAGFGFKDFWRCKKQEDGSDFGYWIKKLV